MDPQIIKALELVLAGMKQSAMSGKAAMFSPKQADGGMDDMPDDTSPMDSAPEDALSDANAMPGDPEEMDPNDPSDDELEELMKSK